MNCEEELNAPYSSYRSTPKAVRPITMRSVPYSPRCIVEHAIKYHFKNYLDAVTESDANARNRLRGQLDVSVPERVSERDRLVEVLSAELARQRVHDVRAERVLEAHRRRLEHAQFDELVLRGRSADVPAHAVLQGEDLA